jgi:hypothetical protein
MSDMGKSRHQQAIEARDRLAALLKEGIEFLLSTISRAASELHLSETLRNRLRANSFFFDIMTRFLL